MPLIRDKAILPQLRLDVKPGNKKYMSKFGKKLRFLRTHQGLTVREMGQAIGISDSHISRLENSQSDPTLTVALKIAQFFNVSLDDLANDETEIQIDT